MSRTPKVSVILANYNGAAFLESALDSIGRQSLGDLEIIVVDDASTDASLAIARKAAAHDPRIRVEALSSNAGPAAARNAGLSLATGEWTAIVDSDDLIHPRRLEHLIGKAEEVGAQIIADDLLVFYEDGGTPHTFLKGRRTRGGGLITLDEYAKENAVLSSRPALGYLKPLFRHQALLANGLLYNEDLRLGEDFDLVARALTAGLKMWIEPVPFYLYRKRSGSISHRLSNEHIQAMLKADEAVRSVAAARGAKAERGLSLRRASLLRARAWNDTVAALKTGKLYAAAKLLAAKPSLLPLLALPVRARLGWLMLRLRATVSTGGETRLAHRVCLISRQRLTAATSGSSRYVLSLANALNAVGYEIHLLQPSPSVFGRLPVLYFRAESKVFKSVKIRGAVKLGPLLFAKNPRVFLAFAKGTVARLAKRFGLHPKDQPAPYSVAAPWTPEDYLFVAKHGPKVADKILYDYAFQTDAAPYLLRPDARSFVIMHDLISSRKAQFARAGAADSMPPIGETEEVRLLSGADVIVAIQEEEAAFVRERAHSRRVITAPMAMITAPAAQPGSDDVMLFVGTSTPPNVLGLNWFLCKVWPLIVDTAPYVKLNIAGTVNRALGHLPQNVRALGVVSSLSPLYRDAGVVVAPLLAGSGLKIKLIEALCHGKAIVATSPTVQGMSTPVKNAVAVRDQPEDFAKTVVELLTDESLRSRYASEALAVAKSHFAAETCYREFLAAFAQEPEAEGREGGPAARAPALT